MMLLLWEGVFINFNRTGRKKGGGCVCVCVHSFKVNVMSLGEE